MRTMKVHELALQLKSMSTTMEMESALLELSKIAGDEQILSETAVRLENESKVAYNYSQAELLYAILTNKNPDNMDYYRGLVRMEKALRLLGEETIEEMFENAKKPEPEHEPDPEIEEIRQGRKGNYRHNQEQYFHVLKLKEQGLNQVQISKRTGVPRTTVGKWCRGEQRLDEKRCLGNSEMILTEEEKEERYSYKLTFKEAEKMRELYKEGKTQMEIATEFGCSQSTVGNIVKNKSWTDPESPYLKKSKGGSKLDGDKVREIRRLSKEECLSYTNIQKKFPEVSRVNIARVIKREIWRHIK